MADLDKVKRNISKMIDQNAPESDIDAYVASEGTSPDQLRAASSSTASETPLPQMVNRADKGDPGLDAGQVGLGTYASDMGSQFVKGVATGIPSIVTGPVQLGIMAGKKLANLTDKYVNGATDQQISENNSVVDQHVATGPMGTFLNLPNAAAKATGIGDAQTAPGTICKYRWRSSPRRDGRPWRPGA